MMYEFFSASLPELFPGSVPGISLEEFDCRARELLPPRAAERLTGSGTNSPGTEVGAAMRRFDEYLARETARLRAARLRVETELPETEECFAEVDRFLPEAAAAAPDEREKLVDAIRWRHLDDLEIGHDFDLAHLAIYRMRLEMLEKYRRRGPHGREDFNSLLARQFPLENNGAVHSVQE